MAFAFKAPQTSSGAGASHDACHLKRLFNRDVHTPVRRFLSTCWPHCPCKVATRCRLMGWIVKVVTSWGSHCEQQVNIYMWSAVKNIYQQPFLVDKILRLHHHSKICMILKKCLGSNSRLFTHWNHLVCSLCVASEVYVHSVVTWLVHLYRVHISSVAILKTLCCIWIKLNQMEDNISA